MHKVCHHIADKEDGDVDFFRYFTGDGTEYYLICSDCFDSLDKLDYNLRELPFESFKKYDNYMFTCIGHRGLPQVKKRNTSLRFEHSTIELNQEIGENILDFQPYNSDSNCKLIALTESMRLILIDLDKSDYSELCRISSDIKIDITQEVRIILASGSDLCAFVNLKGQFGTVINIKTGKLLMELDRGNYYNEVSNFPVAFFDWEGKTLIIHGTDWNRLDITDPLTGENLTKRETDNEKENYLDYFHGEISISDDNQRIVDNGWVWHPVGQIYTWNILKWLNENVWESENGLSRKELCSRNYYWEGSMCWIDKNRIAVYGFGDDEDKIIPAVRLFDVNTGKELMWFAGPDSKLIFDRYLFSIDNIEGTKVWDIDTGKLLHSNASLCPHAYHKATHQFITKITDDKFMMSKLIR